MRRFIGLLVGVFICCYLLGQIVVVDASEEPELAWASPAVMSIKRVSPLESAQSSPNYMANLDCSLATYRLAATSDMRTGCFTETAFGQIDTDTGVVLFNGSDEGLPLFAYSPHQSLVPWPKALNLVALDAATTGSSYISLYKNPLLAIQDKRNLLLQLTGKQLILPPDLQIKDKAGQGLVINPQTLAFSDGGSWMVAETLSGSFVRVNLASLEIKAFAPSFGTQGNPGALMSHIGISDDGHFVAIANEAASKFTVYDLTKCVGTPVNLEPENCPSYDYRPFANSRISGLQSIRHVRFVNEGLLSFEARSSSQAAGGTYLLAPRASITSLTDYIGLGDSYTSGEGAFNYIADTDSSDNMCHLSVHSYPLLLTRDLFSARGGHSVACSGAVINDVGSTSDSYRGQVRDVLDFKHLKEDSPALLNSVITNFAPGYIAQHRFVKKYQPAVVTVSVGGNDVGFGDILEQCVVPHLSRHHSDSTCFNTYEDRLEVMKLVDRTGSRWAALFKQLRSEAPDSRIYAVGYPRVVYDKGNCALNVHFGKSELEFTEELVVYLNTAIQKSAKQAGVTFVDISEALFGHRLCEATSHQVAVNGLTAGKDVGFLGLKVFGRESYHPNTLGHRLIEHAILKKTNRLAAQSAAIDSPDNSQKLLAAPKSGRKITKRTPDNTVTPKVAKAGKPASVKVSGAKNGLKPKTTYKVRLDGPAGREIGTVVSDNVGDLNSGVVLPVDVEPGGHTINITGPNQADEEIDVTQPIYIPVSDTDADGDGLPDGEDSCPAANNSGQDIDQDGIDDICDGFINLPPDHTDSQNELSVSARPGNTLSTSGGISTGLLHPSSSHNGSSKVKLPANPRGNSSAPAVAIFALPKEKAKSPSLSINWTPWIVWMLLLWLLLVLLGVWADQKLSRRHQLAYG